MLPTTRRRQALTLLALAWIAHGITILHQPGWRNTDEAIIYEMWPAGLRIGIWAGCGLVALVLSRVSARDSRLQAVAWALLTIPPTIRVVAHLWSALMWIIPGAPGGEPVAIAYAVWWAAICTLVAMLARWPEVPHD